MKGIKKRHGGFIEWQKAIEAKKRLGLNLGSMLDDCIFGEWQYIYSNDKGQKISLVEFKKFYDEAPWEIYQIDGEQIFEDVIRFKTKKEAKAKCREMLD